MRIPSSIAFNGMLLSGCLLAAAPVLAQEDPTVTLGKMEFQNHCAVCHGLDGKGDGPMAGLLNQPPADLTQIAKNNDGKFPVLDVYQAIDGRRGLRAHGTTDMPIWGNRYRVMAEESLVPHEINYEQVVHGRILSLVYYIQSLQAD